MQGRRISQLIQMRSIGTSDTTSVDSACHPRKWRIVGPAPRDIGRTTCRQRGGEDSSAIGHLTDVDCLRMAASPHERPFAYHASGEDCS